MWNQNTYNQYKAIKFPKRPKVLHGVNIKGINFGMPYYSFAYSSAETITKYVELYRAREKNTEDLKASVGSFAHTNSFYWAMRAHRGDPETTERLNRYNLQDSKIGKELSKLRKQIRKDKWDALKDEILVVVHSKGWAFTFENGYPNWRNRPMQGSILLPVGYNDNDTERYYQYTPPDTDIIYTIKMKYGRGVIDSVVPLNSDFVGESE
jgi:hypothetical protein